VLGPYLDALRYVYSMVFITEQTRCHWRVLQALAYYFIVFSIVAGFIFSQSANLFSVTNKHYATWVNCTIIVRAYKLECCSASFPVSHLLRTK